MRIRLMEARMYKGYSVEKLSKLSGVSKDSINDIESEKSIPRFSTACKIAKALDDDVWNIFQCD